MTSKDYPVIDPALYKMVFNMEREAWDCDSNSTSYW